jgi:hypothetical protein
MVVVEDGRWRVEEKMMMMKKQTRSTRKAKIRHREVTPAHPRLAEECGGCTVQY